MANTGCTRAWPVAAGLTLIVAAAAWHMYHLAGPTEDAFISFRFARHLVAGHGLVWNVGEPPVEGFTNFLWVMICAGFDRCRLDVLRASQSLGVASGLLTILLTYVFARHILRMGRGWSLLPCGMLAVAGPIPLWSTSGLETTFFGLLLLTGCGLVAVGQMHRSSAALLGGCLCLLTATLTRPEGFGVFVVTAALALLLWPGGPTRRQCAVVLAGYLLPFSVYFVWRYTYFGTLWPNTFYAKTGGTVFQWLRGVIYTGYFGLHFVLPAIWIPALLIWERHRVPPKRLRLLDHLRASFGASLSALVTVAYTLQIIYVGGDYLPYYRFFVPVMPFIYLLLARWAQELAESAAFTRARRGMFRLLLAACLAGLLMHSTMIEDLVFSKPAVTQGNYSAARRGYWHTARLKLVGRFFNEYKRDDSESLYTFAIGIISYLSPMKVYDQHGLVDPVVARQPSSRKHPGWGLAGHEKDGLMRALSRKPTFIMFSRNLTPDPLPFPSYPPAAEAILRRDYHLRSVWLDDVENHEKGYFTFLERNDRPASGTDATMHDHP